MEHNKQLILQAFVKANYLKSVVHTEKFSLYCFLDMVFVAFTPDWAENGLLLTRKSAILLEKEPDHFDGFKGLHSSVLLAHSLKFSKELYDKCTSAQGLQEIRAELKEKGYENCMEVSPKASMDPKQLREELTIRVSTSTLTKKASSRLKRAVLKMLICILLAVSTVLLAIFISNKNVKLLCGIFLGCFSIAAFVFGFIAILRWNDLHFYKRRIQEANHGKILTNEEFLPGD